jgi:hypothetical protein
VSVCVCVCLVCVCERPSVRVRVRLRVRLRLRVRVRVWLCMPHAETILYVFLFQYLWGLPMLSERKKKRRISPLI